MATDVNLAFDTEKRGQVALARSIVERNRQDIAKYDSGATQAAIDAHLASQVAKGQIEMIGNGRYKVLTGYDANETFAVQRAVRPGEIPLILPETGLDYVNGKAQLYLAQPAWHEVGNVILGGTTDVATVLNLSGGNYDVEQASVRFQSKRKLLRGWKREMLEVPGQKVNFRTDTGLPLGVVGPKYRIVQNLDAFTFLAELVGKDEVTWESAGPLRGGAKFFVCIRLPEDVIIDAEGIHETIRPYVAVINTHDGSGMFKAIVTPWNIRCGNTERFAVRDALTSWGVRHTSGATAKIEEARRNLGLSVTYFDRWAAEEEQLARIDMELDGFRSFLDKLYDEEPTSKRNATTVAKRNDTLLAMYESQAKILGEKAYTGERVVTDYLDNVAPRRAIGDSMAAARATAVMEDTDGRTKSKAHKLLMTLAA